MPKRSDPPIRQPVHLSPGQMRAAINRFKGLIGDLERFEPQSAQARSDPRIQVLEVSIKDALIETFGHLTPQYNLYKAAALIDTAPHNYAYKVPHAEIIRGLARGKDRAIALVAQAANSLEAKLADLGEPAADDAGAKALRAYEGLDLHPVIARAASDLYRNGHYANAIEDAVKALNNLVRLHSGEDGDGTSLMETVFSPKTDIGWLQSFAKHDAVFLGQLFVDSALRRQGIGTEVVKGLIEEAARAGQALTLGVVKTNPALRLYERLGFRTTHEDERKLYMRRDWRASR